MEQQAQVRSLRKEKELSQEQMEAVLGVSVQAVSKWECAQSYPDLITLVALADYFGLSIDELLRPGREGQAVMHPVNIDMPNDGKLYIVQVRNGEILQKDKYDSDQPISLCTGDSVVDLSVWGSAHIDGYVTGDVSAGGYIECDLIEGNASAGSYIECNAIESNASAGGYIECGDIGGGVNANGNIECSDITGNVKIIGDLSCADITGDIEVSGNLSCGDISGDVTVGGALSYGNIDGDVSAGDNIERGDISVDIKVDVNGTLSCVDTDIDILNS